MMRAVLVMLMAMMLCAACSRAKETAAPVERVVVGPVRLMVEAEGEIRAAQATPLKVPGQQWTQRQPIWLLNDGEPVKTGDVIARFSTDQSDLELTQFLIDLDRNVFSRMAKQAVLASDQGRVDVDLVDVATRLAIAHRYADEDLASIFSRNEILDAIDDETFLNVRQGVLKWKRGQSTRRGATELAVLDAQKESFQRNAAVRRKDLEAAELRAPHAGVLMLARDWAGEVPRPGVDMMAGQVLGYLPDIAALEVELKFPQATSEGLAAGQKAFVHVLGRARDGIETKLSAVTETAQPRSRDNPAPYITLKAPLPVQAVSAQRLVPGMQVRARIELLNIATGISVPNIAVIENQGRTIVYVQARPGAEAERREIELGARGTARSEVRGGLRAGELVVLTPPRATENDKASDPAMNAT
jgi:HlyD family secretion protein